MAMISIERMRELLGAEAVGRSDDEILALRDASYEWAGCVIRLFRSLSPEERAKWTATAKKQRAPEQGVASSSAAKATSRAGRRLGKRR
jgi:hypothetical protein